MEQDNIPSHMHHSGITSGANLQCVQCGSNSNSAPMVNGIAYDMFYDDSFSVGLTKNELDGVMDNFTVQNAGNPTMMHNNMPNCTNYYAFLISKTT